MKKIIYNFLVLSFLSLSFSTACLEENEKQHEKTKISKKDIAKVAAALAGASFFIMAGPMAYYFKLWQLPRKPGEDKPPLKCLPAYAMLPASLLIIAFILNIQNAFFGGKGDANHLLNLFIFSTTVSSLIPTYLLARYAYQKIKQIRAKNEVTSKVDTLGYTSVKMNFLLGC